jgi:hypothetical protein
MVLQTDFFISNPFSVYGKFILLLNAKRVFYM